MAERVVPDLVPGVDEPSHRGTTFDAVDRVTDDEERAATAVTLELSAIGAVHCEGPSSKVSATTGAAIP